MNPLASPELLSGLGILVLEDSTISSHLYSSVFTRRGARVVVAQTIREAEQMLSSVAFDVLVSDLVLPDGSGYDLIRSLRAAESPLNRLVPAVALSSHGDIEHRKLSLASGFQTHLVKPVELEHLVAVVKWTAELKVAPVFPAVPSTGRTITGP